MGEETLAVSKGFSDKPGLGFAIKKLELGSDDVLVIRCNGFLPIHSIQKIEQYFKSRLPGMNILVVDKMVEDFTVIKQDALPSDRQVA